MTKNEAILRLREHDRFLILTHRNPDGDTVGSACALCRGLRSLGKTAYLWPNPQITETYLPFTKGLNAPSGYCAGYTVAVDVADARMLSDGYAGIPELCVDHHFSNSGYAAETYLTPEKAACGEAVLELLQGLGATIDAVTAGMLYAAVSTDCGCFRYRNTNAATHRAAAELMELGADTAELNKRLFGTCSHGRLLLEGMAYGEMRQYLDGTINVLPVSLDMLARAGAVENDCEDLASLAGRLRGVRVSVTLREQPNGETKVSLRTDGTLDASRVCAEFGGGGHPMASGCTLAENLKETERRVVEAIIDLWH